MTLSFAWGCSSGSSRQDAGAGGGSRNADASLGQGGATSTAGGSTAGSTASTSAASGGTLRTGGSTLAGGTVAQTGGAAGSGTSASGGLTGSTSLSSGGSTNAGNTTTGGNTGTGGSRSTGGISATGGATAGGATSPTGGAGAGGTISRGGNTGAGGSTVNTGPALAFPGAQGFGKKTTGGRNGVVVHVTNLNDSGAGSFRDAVSAENRIVLFDVGGYVQLKTAVSVKSNITIAGQTAPGEGIGFRGGEISFAKSSNIIMRYIRIRPGSETASTDDDALSLYLAKTVIIDHSSFEFAPWNNIDGVSDDWQVAPVTDISFQDCLIADPTGQQFGAHTESVSSQWSWYRNIFANSHNRNPLAKVNNVFVNNLLYNYSAGYTTHTSTAFKHDILNNIFVFGPASTGTDNTWFQVDQNQSIYSSGNVKDTNLNGTLDGTTTTPYWYQGQGTVLTTAWSGETTASKALDPASAARVAMSWAGTMPRDPLDALIINQVMTLGKGNTGLGANTVGPGDALYTSQAETGLPNNGYGAIAGGTRPKDTDNDGMSDDWENATGSNPSSDDAMTKAADGYALVERYINWLAEPHASTSAGNPADVDLSSYTKGFSTVSASYAVSEAQNGTATLQSDKRTVRFAPAADFKGLGSFAFTVTGSDNTSYTNRVIVLVAP
ncbi:MAG TPA: hypothetical protein VF518_00455 [Polyangia bacterium]